MPTKLEEIRGDVKRITNDLRIATSMATLKREQAERAEERVVDLGRQLQEANAALESRGLEAAATAESDPE